MNQFGLIGDSHAGIYMRAVKALGEKDFIVGGSVAAGKKYLRPFFKYEDGEFSFLEEDVANNYEMWKAATGSNGITDFKGRLVVSIGLSGASFWNSRFWLTASTRPAKGKKYVSSGALGFFIEAMQEHVLAFYRVCVERELLAAVIAAPAPQRRTRGVKLHGESEVLRLNAMYQRPVREYLAGAGVRVIDLPMADDAGFLKSEFVGDDPLHCGVACGPLLIAELRALAGNWPPDKKPEIKVRPPRYRLGPTGATSHAASVEAPPA